MRRTGWMAVAAACALAACAGPRAPAVAPPPRAAPPATPPPAPAPAPASGARYGAEPRVASTRLEARALEAARARVPAARTSAALSLAARELARAAAAGDTAFGRDAMRGALARGLSFDPSPAIYAVVAGRDAAPAALARALPARVDATHVGVGAYEDGDRVAVVLLAATRKATLSPFPRDVPVGGSAVLSGRLDAPLSEPRIWVTQPDGEVKEADVTGGRAFQSRLVFPSPGRYLVEVVAQRGPGGPEVAALLTVSAGGAALEPARRAAASPEPEDLRAAEAAVVDAINAARRARGLRPLAASPAIAEVARRHSARMLEARTLAHVLPGSGDLGERLRKARVPYARALENVAMGGSARAAHEAAEESPAHLGNILSPVVTLVGVGAARGTSAGGQPVVYLTEVFVEPTAVAAPVSLVAPETRVREVLWAERARARQAPLTSDVRLDALAREAASRMRAEGSPDAAGLGNVAQALGRRLSAVDVFVASQADDAARSANVRDGRFRRVGVGVAVGDSPRFGTGRLWIAVVFTD